LKSKLTTLGFEWCWLCRCCHHELEAPCKRWQRQLDWLAFNATQCNVIHNMSCLHSLLNDGCDSLIIEKIRKHKVSTYRNKTVQISNSFIPHCLDCYQ